MNLCSRRILNLFLLSGATGFAILHCASPVEARVVSADSLPKRFLAEIAVPSSAYYALQAAAQSAAPPAPVAPSAAAAPANLEIPLPDGKGKDVAKRLCSACHSTDMWAGQRHTEDEWNTVIDNMISRGLVASDDELTTVTSYLVTNLGPQKQAPANTATPAASAPAPPPQ